MKIRLRSTEGQVRPLTHAPPNTPTPTQAPPLNSIIAAQIMNAPPPNIDNLVSHFSTLSSDITRSARSIFINLHREGNFTFVIFIVFIRESWVGMFDRVLFGGILEDCLDVNSIQPPDLPKLAGLLTDLYEICPGVFRDKSFGVVRRISRDLNSVQPEAASQSVKYGKVFLIIHYISHVNEYMLCYQSFCELIT